MKYKMGRYNALHLNIYTCIDICVCRYLCVCVYIYICILVKIEKYLAKQKPMREETSHDKLNVSQR